ncbi:type I-E CRISPR-associated protein Cas6/Cse3/CasE [Amycolatopsis sp. NPDC051071]
MATTPSPAYAEDVCRKPSAFTSAFLGTVTGIGRAKAYGCGLLSLAPARK